MGLIQGMRVGPYEVMSSLGAGGMGEVYRARDTKLGRDVALKILSRAFASDPDRLARFDREARTLATLNHPHIAHVYGLEQAGTTSALVMELVDGDDLSTRLARGPVALDEALAIARQIAEALDAAHQAGIVHRDLKPANVKVRRDGVVKVLDFGLAKSLATADGRRQTAEDLATLTSPAITEAGIILGTAAYMSPEQARGQLVDKRTDIWAFGVVFFEMLSGKRVFDGGTVSDSMAAVLTREPDWSMLPTTTPLAVVDLIRRCVRKDPKRRLRDIGDAVVVLDDVISAPPATTTTTDHAARGPRAVLPWTLAGMMTVVAAAAIWMSFSWRTAPERRDPAHVALTLPPDATMFLGRGSSVAVSPDGKQIAYVATVDKRTQLYLRSLERMDSATFPATAGASNPFFSPDGQWVGFWADGKLKRLNLQGRTVETITDASNLRGEAWGPDNTILLTPTNGAGLWRVPASGGKAEPFTTRLEGELSHRWPQFVPGGHAVVFTIWNDTGFEGGRIAVQRLDGREHRVLIQGGGYGRIVQVDRGHVYLIYAQTEGLIAVPFDLDRLELTSTPTPVVAGVTTNLSGGAHYAVSNSGTLAYLPGSLSEAPKTVLSIDRTGKETVLGVVADLGQEFAVTADGTRLVRVNTQGLDRDLWLEDLAKGLSTRLTKGGSHFTMTLTADERRVAYSVGLPSASLFWRSIDGTGEEERLTTGAHAQFAESISPDGKVLAYVEVDPIRGNDIWTVSLERDHTTRPFLRTEFNEGNPDFSPDGRWLAYQSNESGRFEIYVASFPEPSTRTQVTTAGGIRPRWSGNGSELFYQIDNRTMAVPITRGQELKSGQPKLLFAGTYLGPGDYASGADRFIMLRDNGQDTAGKTIYLVMNWFDELRQKLGQK